MTSFIRCVVEVEPGDVLDHESPMWQDAIVFVVVGTIDVACTDGERHRFCCGDILTFAHLPLTRVHNAGTTPTRLLAISRRTITGELRPAAPSHRRPPDLE